MEEVPTTYRFVDIDTKHDPTSESIEEKGKELITQMNMVNEDQDISQDKKDKIQKEIFKEMMKLSKQIRAQYDNGKITPFMSEFYQSVCQKPIQTQVVYAKRLPVYRDRWKMFQRVDPSRQSAEFWKRMAVELGGVDENNVHNALMSPQQDGMRKIFMLVMTQCDRKKYMHSKSKQHCKDCWNRIMKESLVHLVQTTLIHAREMMEKVKSFMDNNTLTSECATIVLNTVTHSVRKMKNLLVSARKCKTIKAWNDHIDKMFQINISFENQLLDSLMQCASSRQTALIK